MPHKNYSEQEDALAALRSPLANANGDNQMDHHMDFIQLLRRWRHGTTYTYKTRTITLLLGEAIYCGPCKFIARDNMHAGKRPEIQDNLNGLAAGLRSEERDRQGSSGGPKNSRVSPRWALIF
jgi:hypothetical protein